MGWEMFKVAGYNGRCITLRGKREQLKRDNRPPWDNSVCPSLLKQTASAELFMRNVWTNSLVWRQDENKKQN